MKYIRPFKILLLVTLISLATACGSVQEQVESEEIRIAFVYNGPVGDLGWITSHEQGRVYLDETVANVQTTFVENVAEGPEAERVIRDFASQGYDLIFTTTHGFGDATLRVASEFPNVNFEHATGFETAPNVSTYFGRMYQARFLTGVVAASMTESDILGFVAAFPIPQVVRGINGFALGAQAVNPDVEVRVLWTNTWFDPVLEREAAQTLIDGGADVIAQHQNSPEVQKVAAENDVWSIGYNTDMSQQAPESVLTSAIWNWGPYYVSRAEAVLNGAWTSHRYWGGLEDPIVDLAPYHEDVPQETRELVEEWRERIANTDWDVFQGPIFAQNGALVLAEGDEFTDEYLLNDMDWLVQGVIGEAGDPPPPVDQ